STLKKRFKRCVIGFSDHSEGYEAACAAVALGAKIIEKHFTLDKHMWGPDHKASFNPGEFARLVKAVRNTELSLGSSVIRVLDSEARQKYSMQKSIFARRDIPKGKKILLEDLIFLRPAGGISPLDYKLIVGKKNKLSIKSGTRFDWGFLSLK
ncbi:MAG: N-acetylneuraminate synthase family protein, partial [Candidatus Omnitrophica bacterium]|nr:N-acetylneuraminate synthase family protein [Candidatus Omnitrophota bacterium]